MKFVKYLIFIILIFCIGFSIYIAVQPNTFKISKFNTIKAPARVIFETLKDSTTYSEWSNWLATHIEESNFSENPFEIQQKITPSKLPHSYSNWQLKPNGDGTTNVEWTLQADSVSFGNKVKAFFKGGYENLMDLNNDSSLDQLNDLVIKNMQVYRVTIDGITEYGGGFYMYKTTSSNASNISNTIAKQYADILNYMNSNTIPTSGMPFTIYLQRDFDNGDVIMSNAIPVNNQVIVTEDSNVLCGFMERTTAVKVTLKGNYTNLNEAWTKAYQYLKDKQLTASEMSPFEIYINDPGDNPNPAHWITEIYIPIKTQELEPTL